MSVKPVRIFDWIWMARCLFGVWFGVLCWQASGAVAGISIRRTDSSVTLEWPSKLGWVQVQGATVLSPGAWADLGAATSEAVVQESLVSGVAFYRLRFLSPSIRVQPESRSVVPGASVVLNVEAFGSAPLAFHWRRSICQL